MSVKEDQEAFEKEKTARASKIKTYLQGKAEPKAKRKAHPKAKPQAALPAETMAEPSTPSTVNQPISIPVRDSSAPNGLRYRPMKPWERMEGNRVVQFRPMTRREREAEQEFKFLASVKRDDEAHKEQRRKADEEAKQWAKEDRQRREHEERTGLREYEPGRYLDIEDAVRQGYIQGK
ncbi:MAG: hypothetical protein JSR62_03625 [Nitrospira sp.]|nr:hypothetical protein [Nitrospira sp.]